MQSTCKKNLTLGDLITFKSEKKPIRNIKIKNKLILNFSIKKKVIKIMIPPDNGILFCSTNSWCLSPDKLGRRFMCFMKLFTKYMISGIAKV